MLVKSGMMVIHVDIASTAEPCFFEHLLPGRMHGKVFVTHEGWHVWGNIFRVG